jgi:hypothetical protein
MQYCYNKDVHDSILASVRLHFVAKPIDRGRSKFIG